MSISCNRVVTMLVITSTLCLGTAVADTYTYNTTISPPPPTEVTYTNLVTFSFDVTQHFTQVQSVAFYSLFTGDLWDSGEGYFIYTPDHGEAIGQINQDQTSRSAAYIDDVGDPHLFQFIIDGGPQTWQFTMEGPGQSVGLASVTVIVNGMATPEPGGLVLFGTGVAGGWRLLRRKRP